MFNCTVCVCSGSGSDSGITIRINNLILLHFGVSVCLECMRFGVQLQQENASPCPNEVEMGLKETAAFVIIHYINTHAERSNWKCSWCIHRPAQNKPVGRMVIIIVGYGDDLSRCFKSTIFFR